MSYTLGIVGGSGVYELEGLVDVREVAVETPFGRPSDALVTGRLGDTKLVFLSRHGRGHKAAPHEINYRANFCALKMQGVTHCVSISAVGSMKEEIRPGDLVVVDQYIDLTKKRASTFFEDGIVGHVPFSTPVCPVLGERLATSVERAGGTLHRGGTYVCMEGPQFSTRAESLVYRSWGVSVIGMTAMPEAKLARECEIPHATLALATDYDCWHDSEEPVTVDAVLAVVRKNVALAKRVIAELARDLPDPAKSPARGALAGAIMTAKEAVTPEAKKRLGWLLHEEWK